MIWYLIGNNWLDNHTRHVKDLHEELESSACRMSPLDSKDREAIAKACEKYNKVVERVYKRLQKAQKGKKK